MAVYHFTLHAYRSWSPSHPRGYVRRGQGVLAPDPEMAAAYDRVATQDGVVFTPALQAVLVWGAHDACARRGWRLHAVGTDPFHLHLVVSWRAFIACEKVMNKLKNVLSYLLGTAAGLRGKRWFVRDGSRRRVTRREHLDYLIGRYLPDHRGVFWREGMSCPAKPVCLETDGNG